VVGDDGERQHQAWRAHYHTLAEAWSQPTLRVGPKNASTATTHAPLTPSSLTHPPPHTHTQQVAQLVALSVAWFVYSSWWPLALNMALMFAVAQLGTRDVWSLSPDVQRARHHLVVFIAALAACYWFPMALQATRDVAMHLAAGGGGIAVSAGGPAVAVAPPSLAAARFAAGTFLSLALGGAVFATGFPERLVPGVFDCIGFSHQLMHVGAIGAFVCEYLFVLEMWQRRHGREGV